MTKLRFLPAIAAAALAFTACTSDKLEAVSGQSNNNPENPDNAITFGTYMGRTSTTRAGAEGSIDTEVLKGASYGFGVFAYYTGNDAYAQNSTANFMYNQKVTWNATNRAETSGYITSWAYTPVKYWPNDFAYGTAVDDQDNDGKTNPATGSSVYGGKVSFFAYAPYVALPITNSSTEGGLTDGIVAINGTDKLGEAATTEPVAPAKGNQKQGDPTITYKIADDGNVVDLLWGTYNGTGKNVLGAENAGVESSASDDPVVTTPLTSTHEYKADILQGYKVNADLTKQKTSGTVGFAFKHALSKVGGSNTSSPSGTVTPNGLMVMLDIDDMKGAETGGTKDGTTLVTIKEIAISAKAYTPDASGKGYGTTDYTTTYFTNGGSVLDLATGKWDLSGARSATATDASTTNHTINASGTSANATLAAAIAENATPTYTSSSWSQTGVTTNKQNVYESETNPFVFIPGTYPELTITVDYIVRTYDENLVAPATGESTCSKIEQKITKKLTFTKPVELNKQYNILMHLGLTSVKFTATVSDWVLNGTDTDDDGIIEEGEVEISDVYVPRNVGASFITYTMTGTTPVAATGGDSNKVTIAPALKKTNATTGAVEADSQANTWSFESNDTSVATVNASGEVTFIENTTKAKRSVIITVSSSVSDVEPVRISIGQDAAS